MDDIIVAAQNHFSSRTKQHLLIHVLEEKERNIPNWRPILKLKLALNLNPVEEGKKYLLQLLKRFMLRRNGRSTVY